MQPTAQFSSSGLSISQKLRVEGQEQDRALTCFIQWAYLKVGFLPTRFSGQHPNQRLAGHGRLVHGFHRLQTHVNSKLNVLLSLHKLKVSQSELGDFTLWNSSILASLSFQLLESSCCRQEAGSTPAASSSHTSGWNDNKMSETKT